MAFRKSIRLPTYDYCQHGAYFVTLCTQGRDCILDDPIISGILCKTWCALPTRFSSIALDEFVVMPNHIHFIVWLQANREDVAATPGVQVLGQPPASADTLPALKIMSGPNNPSLGDVVGTFKSLAFAIYLDWLRLHQVQRQARFWQRNYYEHIVRNSRELAAIRKYIRDNPMNWLHDRDNLDNVLGLQPPNDIQDYLNDIGDIT